jgi:hypothetical protein
MPDKQTNNSQTLPKGQRFIWIGALIVFFTFAVKDLWRDSLREELDAFDSAKTAWVIRESEIDNKSDLRATSDMVYQLYDHLIKGLPMIPNKRHLSLLLRLSQSQMAQEWMQATLTNDSDLARVMEGKGGIFLRVDQLNKRFRTLPNLPGSEIVSEILNPNQDPPIRRRNAQSLEATVKTVEQDLKTWETDMFPLMRDIGDFDSSVQRRMDEVIKRKRLEYGYVNKFSIGAFAIGWAFALYGRLHKNESFAM